MVKSRLIKKCFKRYFLGSLVLKRTHNTEFAEYEVLDGQQRLTTFFMVCAVRGDLMTDDEYANTMQTMIYQRENRLKRIPARQRITYQIRDDVEDFTEDERKYWTPEVLIKRQKDLINLQHVRLPNIIR